MTRLIRSLLVVTLLVPALGCKDEVKPTAEMKIPDVPASGSSQGKGDMTTPKGKK